MSNNAAHTSIEELKQIVLDDKNYLNRLNFLHVNTRSLIHNIDNLHQLLCKLPKEPDIIFVTETKLNKRSNINFTHLDNYTFINKDSFSNAGGVGLYLKNSLKFEIRKDLNLINNDVESLWAKVQISKTQSITIGVIYKHPNGNISEFTDLFNEILTKLNNEKLKCYIMGDLNINMLEKSTKTAINKYSLMIKSTNFHNLIKLPTRITKTTATCLDHFYTNYKESVINKFVLIDNLSDHLPILGVINLKHKNKQPETM